MNNKRILLIGGGTGGHFVPIFWLFKKIKKISPRTRLKIIGSGANIEKRYFRNIPEYSSILTGKLHRKKQYKNIFESFKLLVGFLQALFVLISFRPNIIFSKGGYVSAPLIFWAKLFGIHYFIHESDIDMGKANLFAADKAKKIYTGFPTKYYDMANCEYVGQMIELPQKGKFDFGFDDEPVVTVLGGSQGSKSINQVIYDLIGELLPKYNVIHQVGEEKFEDARAVKDALSNEYQKRYFITDFISFDESPDISDILYSSDVVVCRAGATTMAEVAYVQKPMILVPYIHAANDHQTKNAEAIEADGGAIVIDGKDLKGRLIDVINNVVGDQPNTNSMTTRAIQFFKKDAINKIANDLIAFTVEEK